MERGLRSSIATSSLLKMDFATENSSVWNHPIPPASGNPEREPLLSNGAKKVQDRTNDREVEISVSGRSLKAQGLNFVRKNWREFRLGSTGIFSRDFRGFYHSKTGDSHEMGFCPEWRPFKSGLGCDASGGL